MDDMKISCAPTNPKPSDWNSIDWNSCQSGIKKLQARIVKAQKEGRYGKVKSLQWILTHSFYAKAMAIKRVTSNKGKKTSGVDKVIWSTPEAKFNAIADMTRKGYKPSPLKRVNIRKGNGKQRPLGIPTMKDRAMQALYLMALDPVAETTADRHSYGFRKERSTHDAIEQCFKTLNREYHAQWILEGDIKGCFDHISHEWLLKNIPMDRVILKKWLTCGFIFRKQLFPTEEGTPQGGIISPTLANMTLDGIQAMLARECRPVKINSKRYCPKVNLIRYADDFVITADSKGRLEEKIIPLIKEFLLQRGLTLSEEKTRITHISEGFDFLGFNLRKYKNTLLIKPSRESQKKFLRKIKETIRLNRACRQDMLIHTLNPMLRGWSNYYRYSVASKTFSRIDHLIFCKVWEWAKRRHPKKGLKWIARRYFRTVNNQKWRFAVNTLSKKENITLLLRRLSLTKITRYTKVRAEANPYDTEWIPYFEKRETDKMLSTFKGQRSILHIWERQLRKCPVCHTPIDRNTAWSMTERMEEYKIVKYLIHTHCRGRLKLFNGM